VLDFLPRTATEADVALLTDLAAVVMDELELRLSARKAVANYQEELTQRELREDRIKGLLRELAHRSKNLLAVVQAIASHTMPDSGIARRYAARLAARVQGLAHTHDLMAEEDWQGARMDDLAARQIGHFVEPVAPRLELMGPSVLLVPAVAQNVGLALHELAANAVEYGAFSLPQGSVSIMWSLQNHETPNGWLQITWRERGGPPVKTIDQKGFGHLVLEHLVPEGVGGTGQLSFAPDGVTWCCEMSASRIQRANTV
jgi:two-component sensor histidine kinase